MQKLCRSYAEVGAVCVKDSSGGALCAAVALRGTDVGLGVSGRSRVGLGSRKCHVNDVWQNSCCKGHLAKLMRQITCSKHSTCIEGHLTKHMQKVDPGCVS